MQHNAALAYQKVGTQTASPRVLEANLLSRAATQLQRIRDDWENSSSELQNALHFNRRLWMIFLNSVLADDCELPRELRENVGNLGLFVMKHTIATQTRPEAQKLDVLININRQLAAGLRASAEALER